VETLIKAGSDLNARDKNSWTPLMNACYWANQDAALALLEAGAEAHLKNIVYKSLYKLFPLVFNF
jgi:ankyrin repeat protein